LHSGSFFGRTHGHFPKDAETVWGKAVSLFLSLPLPPFLFFVAQRFFPLCMYASPPLVAFRAGRCGGTFLAWLDFLPPFPFSARVDDVSFLQAEYLPSLDRQR